MQRTASCLRRSYLLTTAVLGLLSFSFTSSMLGQGNSAPKVTSTTINVEEVSLDLVARDKSGQPITGLRPGDLEILDGGSPVRIKDIREVNDTHPVMLVFDRMEPGNAKSARDAALAIVKAAHEGTQFTVLAIDQRLHLMHAPSSDPVALKTAIDAATIAEGSVSAAQSAAAEKSMTEDAQGGPRQDSAKMLLAILLDSQKAVEDPHMTPSVAGLLAVSRGQQEVPGRKTVIYFSQSLRWNVSDPESLRDIISAANRAHVSIDSMDAHNIDPNAAGQLVAAAALANQAAGGNIGVGQASGAGPGGPAPGTAAAGGDTSTVVSEQMGRFSQTDLGAGSNKSPLESICATTGGLHVVTGDRNGTRRIAEDLSSYYVASFTPAAGAEDGRFRRVQVKALRSGMVLEARAGYFAVPLPAGALTASFEGALLQALAAPELATDLPLHSAALRFGNTEHVDSDAVVVEVPLSGVEIKSDEAAKTYAAHVAILAELKDKSGAVVQKFSEDVPRQGALDQQDKAKSDVITMRRHFSAAPGDYVLETVAMDVNSGKIGAQRTDLVIPRTASGASLSDIVVARKIDPFHNDADKDTASPLRCADGRVIPNLSGHVSKAADPTLTLFFDIHPNTASNDPLDLKAEVSVNGKLAGTVPLRVSQNAKDPTIPYLAQLGTAKLPLGEYDFKIILKQGGETSSQSVEFTLDE
jgi:VWFA-related protein